MSKPTVPSFDLAARREKYRTALLDNVLPVWTRHAKDAQHGGYSTSLDRDGTVYDTDKPVWFLGRFAWMLAQAALTFPEDPRAADWVRLARHGVDFSLKHGFAPDGQMYFLLDKKGAPLRKRRYVYSELFAAMAYATTARAERELLGIDDNGELSRRAVAVYQSVGQRLAGGSLEPKIDPATRPLRGLGLPMIQLHTIQCLREMVPEDVLHAAGLDVMAAADDCIRDLEVHFHRDRRTVFETLRADGSPLGDCVEGRTLNPGHAIEAAWFLMAEAQSRGLQTARGKQLLALGIEALDWMWEWGWDKEHGGILYYRDSEGFPVQDYWHDMKFWWPQNEAEIATLLAWQITEESRYERWYTQIHDYAWKLFPDAKHGEWFGYFARDGRRTSDAKGNHFKGPFHVPRMMWKCYQTLEACD